MKLAEEAWRSMAEQAARAAGSGVDLAAAAAAEVGSNPRGELGREDCNSWEAQWSMKEKNSHHLAS